MPPNNYKLASVINNAGYFTLHSPDPFDQIVYSPVVPVDPGQVLAISSRHSSSVYVSAGYKLLLWLGQAESQCKPGATGFLAYTVGIGDLNTTEVFTGAQKTVPAGIEYVRVAFEVDTCSAKVNGVTVDVYDLILKAPANP